jgi:adenosylcobinamide-phosphate synthase
MPVIPVAAIVLGGAAILDYLIGDPWGWPHPVRGMGFVISTYSHWIFKQQFPMLIQKLAGVMLGVGLVIGSGSIGWVLVALATSVHPWFGTTIAILLLATCFAGRSLRDAAYSVLKPLAAGNLIQTRSHLQQYVGRDTEQLDPPEILRAILETVTENATDGVMAPLFYALVGACLPGVGSVPVALAYKAASTLDSMVGYRQAPYTHLGWFSARMDDGLTWIPCRLTVLTLAFLSLKPWRVLTICLRDAPADPSPNSGWSEAAYAAILGVQVGGLNWYQGVAKQKPLLGDPIQSIEPRHVQHALALTRFSFLIWLGLGIVGCLWIDLHVK